MCASFVDQLRESVS